MFWRAPLSEVKIKETVERVVRDCFKTVDDEISKICSMADLSAKVKALREEIEELTVERDRKAEDYARKERELEHKVGLHKQQVEQDIALAKREATVSLREENLKADRTRFEEQMAFVTKNFDKQTEYLKTIIGNLAERLPSLEMTADVGRHTTRK